MQTMCPVEAPSDQRSVVKNYLSEQLYVPTLSVLWWVSQFGMIQYLEHVTTGVLTD